MERSPRNRNVVGRALRRLDSWFGLDRGASRGERFWLAPLAVLVGTTLGFLVIGTATAAPLYVSVPNGVMIALVMSGLSIACLSPSGDGGTDEPPGDDGDGPVLGSPGGPWTLVAHLGPARPGLGDVAAHREDPAEEGEHQPPAKEDQPALPVG